MTTRVRTEKVRDTLIGQARTKLKEAAGPSGPALISRKEENKLPEDLKRAVDFARKKKPRVTVEDAVASYAKHVSQVLGAVDKKGRGILSEKEAKAITDTALRSRVLDVRAELLGRAEGSSGGPGPVNAGKLAAKIEDRQEEWGSENIMDGIVALSSSIVMENAAKTANRDFDALKADETVSSFIGERQIEGPHRVGDADLKKLATAINDDGFQYAKRDQVGRIQGQIKDVLKALGGPAGLEMAVVRQNVYPDHLDLGDDTKGLPAELWTFRNAKTEDSVSFVVVKGTL
jgi:hypothetical protein